MMFSLLLAICALPPLFDMSGPPCVELTAPCVCSECLEWDVYPDAMRYEILRLNESGTTINVGTSHIRGGYVNEDGTIEPADPQELWCFANDSSFVVEGRRYEYSVRALRADGVWTPWSHEIGEPRVVYIAAPYWCWIDGIRKTCR